jgi:hypothetical protein
MNKQIPKRACNLVGITQIFRMFIKTAYFKKFDALYMNGIPVSIS